MLGDWVHVGDFARVTRQSRTRCRAFLRANKEQALIRQSRRLCVFYCAAVFCGAIFAERSALADAYDPPAGYYSTATGTAATLKAQLNNIIDGHSTRTYDDLRSDLQVSDADPANPNKIRVVYNNGATLTKPTGGSIPGWDGGTTWNREHSWPQSRGLDSEAAPDGSDMHHLFPSKMIDNSTRGNLNFGGEFGAQNRGVVNDGGTKYYPGDVDAGLIARAQFYMDVRYDGADSGTSDLELATGNPADDGTMLGDLNRLLEWHFAAPPDTFERSRNQIIYDAYQHNRNPFIDRPEFAWSVFAKDGTGNPLANNSQISIAGSTVNADGSSSRNVDLGRVFVGAAAPAAQAFTLNKAGTHGTYYSVTTAGAATSSITGRYNAFRTDQADTRAINIGLIAPTATAGGKSGTVTIDNLDITTGGGSGVGANDANDVFNVSLAVLDHVTPSFASSQLTTSLTHNFGNVAINESAPIFNFDIFNLNTTAGYTASMDFDSVTPAGSSSAFTTNFAASAGSLAIAGGGGQTFSTLLNLTAVGTFSATYTLNFSDENIAGALNKSLTLTLAGIVRLAGDYNRDNAVDAADYAVWRSEYGSATAAFNGADGDGDGTVGDGDFAVWRSHFGDTAPAAGLGAGSLVPEPGAISLFALGLLVMAVARGQHRAS
jgi:endonuclease I